MITFLKISVLSKIFSDGKEKTNPLFSKQQILYTLIIEKTLSVIRGSVLVQIQLMFSN